MDQSTPYLRRFDVHHPLKRHKGVEFAEPQEQNPLQSWLGKRKGAPGLEALLSEARADNDSQKDGLIRAVDFDLQMEERGASGVSVQELRTAEFDRGPYHWGSQQPAAKKQVVENESSFAVRKPVDKSMLSGPKFSPGKKKQKKGGKPQEKASNRLKSPKKQKKQSVHLAKPESNTKDKTYPGKPPATGAELPRKQPNPPKHVIPGRPSAVVEANHRTSDTQEEKLRHVNNGPAEATFRPTAFNNGGQGSNPVLNRGFVGRLGDSRGEPQIASRKTQWDVPGPVEVCARRDISGPSCISASTRDCANGLEFRTGGVAGSFKESEGNVSKESRGHERGKSEREATGFPLGQEVQVSLQAQECQRLWEALQTSLSTWKSVLVQRDGELSERSASLAQQSAQSKVHQETATEQLATARRLRQAAEEIHAAAMQERQRASAELKETRQERAAIERAKEELESRREEMATEAMELNQKRKLCEEALARLETEKAAAQGRSDHASLPMSQSIPVLRSTAPQDEDSPPNPPSRTTTGKGQDDLSKATPDFHRASADVKSGSNSRMLNGKPKLNILGGLMKVREGSGSPSPLGLYRGLGQQQTVKIEEVDLSEEEKHATPTGRNSEQTTEDRSKGTGNLEIVAEKSDRSDRTDAPAKQEAESDEEDDVPLSLRNGLRKLAMSQTVPESERERADANNENVQKAENQTGQRSEAAALVGEVKAELAKGPQVESVPAAQNAGASAKAVSKAQSGTGPLGRYPSSMAHPTALKKQKQKRTAIEVLRKDAPELLESLSETGMLDDMKLYGEEFDGDEEAAQSATFRALQNILNKIYDATPSRSGQAWTSSGNFGQTQLPKYCMGALKVLTDEAKRLRKGNRPVEWGWCHGLHAFLFVFEEQNRFVLEWPHYGNATYFFNMEARDVDFQLRRLIAVLSIAGVTKNDIVDDRPLERIKGIPSEDLRILEDFGRKPGTGLGSFLNFANRVVHDYKDECTLEQWQTRIRSELHEGRNTGQIDKSPGVPMWAVLGEVVPFALGGALPFRQQEVLAVKAELG